MNTTNLSAFQSQNYRWQNRKVQCLRGRFLKVGLLRRNEECLSRQDILPQKGGWSVGTARLCRSGVKGEWGRAGPCRICLPFILFSILSSIILWFRATYINALGLMRWRNCKSWTFRSFLLVADVKQVYLQQMSFGAKNKQIWHFWREDTNNVHMSGVFGVELVTVLEPKNI